MVFYKFLFYKTKSCFKSRGSYLVTMCLMIHPVNKKYMYDTKLKMQAKALH